MSHIHCCAVMNCSGKMLYTIELIVEQQINCVPGVITQMDSGETETLSISDYVVFVL